MLILEEKLKKGARKLLNAKHDESQNAKDNRLTLSMCVCV